jgi:GTPase SAR1 family protein
MEIDDYHFKFKFVILGDKHVGKTTLVDSLANNFGKVIETESSEEYYSY